jgi:5-methylcytosine-specific restriction protein B
MTLDEYTGIGKQGTFCYWIEKRLEKLGSIWGGSSFKFGIYRRRDQTPKPSHPRYTYTEEFAWESKFGNSALEAFETVKQHILSVIKSIKEKELLPIESVPLWPVFKWKIAFLYQDRNAPLLPAVFKAEMLTDYLEIDQGSQTESYPSLYPRVMKDRADRDIAAFSHHVWTKANQIAAKKRFQPQDAEQLLFQRYHPISNGTRKVIGFLNDSSRTIALLRKGNSVRVVIEPCEPLLKNVKVKKRYSVKDSRNANFDKQAPNVANGTEAVLIECSKKGAFEELLDIYEIDRKQGLDSMDEQTNVEKLANNQPLNQILYGPPGTGKTFYTVNKALQVLDPAFYESHLHDRPALRERFQELKQDGRVGFVTFHQSFSYEDFVEGLKATSENGEISYEVADGIFKQMCEETRPHIEKESFKAINVSGRKIWKMSLGNTLGSDSFVYDKCIEADEIRLGYGADIDFTECSSRNEISTKFTDLGYELKPQDYQVTSVDIFKNQMNIGDIVIVSDGNLKFRAIAEIVDEYQCLPDSEFPDYVQTRKVIWHRVYEKSLPYERVLVKKFSQMTLYKLSAKTVDMAKLQSLLSSNEKVEGSRGLSVGKKLGNGEHEVASISDEIIRLKSNKTGSLIPFDREIINELLGYVRQGSLTVEDIAKKKVFEITASKLEKYIVNGYPGLLSKLVSLMAEPGMSNTRDDAEIDNRVLIIDEINRGNISSIFGELITLLEPSKRAGAEEALSVTLPYSKETFQVPNNLYLIGTMNTADRSLALMDTALRRRFDFVEMMPDVELLANLEVKGIDIKSLLIKMNKRIEVLYDREHILGHAFFIPLLLEEDEEKQFKMLQNIFENKILPLLEEYFFEDWEKIRLVLGDGNKETQNQFITVNNGGFDTETLFGKGVELEYDAEGVILYSRSKDALGFVASYIGIYES